MKNYTLYRYDYGWDAFEKANCLAEFKDCYGYTPSDDELDEYINNVTLDNWNFMMDEINFYEKENGKKQYVVLAKIGTWRGTFDSGKIVKGLAETISVCCRDCDFVTIFYKNNQLRIVGHHHDGTNTFVVREMTDAGDDYSYRHQYDQTDGELCNHVFNSHRWSRMVSLFPKVYGWV